MISTYLSTFEGAIIKAKKKIRAKEDEAENAEKNRQDNSDN